MPQGERRGSPCGGACLWRCEGAGPVASERPRLSPVGGQPLNVSRHPGRAAAPSPARTRSVHNWDNLCGQRLRCWVAVLQVESRARPAQLALGVRRARGPDPSRRSCEESSGATRCCDATSGVQGGSAGASCPACGQSQRRCPKKGSGNAQRRRRRARKRLAGALSGAPLPLHRLGLVAALVQRLPPSREQPPQLPRVLAAGSPACR